MNARYLISNILMRMLRSLNMQHQRMINNRRHNQRQSHHHLVCYSNMLIDMYQPNNSWMYNHRYPTSGSHHHNNVSQLHMLLRMQYPVVLIHLLLLYYTTHIYIKWRCNTYQIYKLDDVTYHKWSSIVHHRHQMMKWLLMTLNHS